MTTTLYARLGGYDAMAAVVEDLFRRLAKDPKLGRFWAYRSEDGSRREMQLLIEYLCASAGGPVYYTGQDVKVVHKGMHIDESDWASFRVHLGAAMDAFNVPAAEQADVVAFVESKKADVVE